MRLLLLHSLERDAGHLRDNVHHVVRGHEHFLLFPFLTPAGQNTVELLLRLLFFVPKSGGFLEILGLDRRLFFDANVFDFLFDFLDIRRSRHRVDPRTRASFIHDVNRFIWKKTTRDITLGKFHGGFERFVSQLRLVVRFVFRAQPFENQNCFFDRGRVDFHCLKTTFQGRVFFNILAIFVQRRGTDALQFAAAQGGLDDVRSVHGALRRTGPDNRVQFVDKQDHILGSADFIHDRLDALFKLAAIFRSGDHQREIERDYFLVAQ